MNILQITPSMVECSITRIIEMILVKNTRDDINWFIAGPDPDFYTKRYPELGAQITHYAYDDDTSTRMGKLAAAKKLRAYIQAHHIDLIHSHTPTTTVLAWLASRDLPVRRIYTKHLLTYPKDRDYGLIYTAVDRLSLYQTNHIMPVSETMTKIIRGYPLLNESNVTTIRNAVDLDHYSVPEERDAVRKEFGVTDDEIVFGFTGRLEPMKRLDWLLDCFQKVVQAYDNARLVIVGEGALEKQLKDYAESLGITHKVIFTGWRKDVPRILAGIDIYLQPSSNEGLSLSIIEAMSADNAIIATEVGGIHEIIETEVTGIIVDPLDKEGYTSAMLDMIADPDKRKRLSQAGKDFVWKYFNVERMTSSYIDMYAKFM